MEIQTIKEALRATTVAENQQHASEYLKESSKMIGFSQILFDLATPNDDSVEYAVRQAAVIYLKNLVHKSWVVDEDDKELPLSEQDKTPIRRRIISAIVNAPEPIRIHLCSCIQYIMRNDFPKNWPGLLDELVTLLHTPNGAELLGALLVILRLCKVYEYKNQEEKAPLMEVMKHILPLLQQRLTSLLTDAQCNSQASCLLQKMILKIFFCLVQFSLNTEAIPVEDFSGWIKLFLAIIECGIPPECEELETESMEDTIWWKCKKWALRIISRVFERYGSKGQVEETYATFAEWYSKEFAVPVIDSILKHVLTDYANKKFVSNWVLFLAVGHLAEALSQAQIWIVVKPHFQELLRCVIFPLLAHTEEDEQIWDDDPQEYLRCKYDTFIDLHEPSAAASQLLQGMARRKGVLQPTLEFILSHLTSSATSLDIDSALHMISVLSPTLIKNKKYKKDMEKLIHAHIVPRISHEVRFVRARACYAVKCAADAPFSPSGKILPQLIHALVERLKMSDEELPVKVEAATAIQALINDQGQKVLSLVRPHVRDILMEVLKLTSRTHVDELPPVVDSLLENFEDEVIPVAYDVAVELVNIFDSLAGMADNEDQLDEDAGGENVVTIMGVLSTLETILCLVEEHEQEKKPFGNMYFLLQCSNDKEIVKRVEPVVRGCIIKIFDNYCGDYFDESLSLAQTLISVSISSEMWQVYDLIYSIFTREGTSFFVDCMPVLHSFLTNDTDAFLSVPTRTQYLLEMCEKTLHDPEAGDEAHIHAVKLFEVFILQCHGRVDQFVPGILQLTLNRLQQPLGQGLGDLKTQLLVVFIAAFYANSEVFLHALNQLNPTVTFEWLVKEIIANKDNFNGVHDRKMIIFLMCKVISISYEHLPDEIRNNPKLIMDFCLSQFEGLQRCIKAQAENRASDDDSSEGSSDDGDDDRMNDELNDSDDDVDEGTLEYLESLKKKGRKKRNSTMNSIDNSEVHDEFGEFRSDSSDSDYHHFVDETEMETYTTPLDAEEGGLNVFLLFKSTFQDAQTSNPALFNSLVSSLDEEKATELQKLMTVCTQHENLEQSKKVSLGGGYAFESTAVPNNFKFS